MTVVFQSTTPAGVTFQGSSIYRVAFGGFIGQAIDIAAAITAYLQSLPGYDADNQNLYLNSSFEWVEVVGAPVNNVFPFTFPYNLS